MREGVHVLQPVLQPRLALGVVGHDEERGLEDRVQLVDRGDGNAALAGAGAVPEHQNVGGVAQVRELVTAALVAKLHIEPWDRLGRRPRKVPIGSTKHLVGCSLGRARPPSKVGRVRLVQGRRRVCAEDVHRVSVEGDDDPALRLEIEARPRSGRARRREDVEVDEPEPVFELR